MVKTITVTEEAYRALKDRKGGRSFSQVLLDTFGSRRCTGEDLRRILERMEPLTDKEYRAFKARHRAFKREFDKEIESRRKRLWNA